MQEVFVKPAVGAIIERNVNGRDCILIQQRYKEGDTDRLFEIPTGKIREYEDIFQTLRREIREETGLKIKEIKGEGDVTVSKVNGYTVTSFMPFYVSQNLCGGYSLMVQVFIFKADVEPFEKSDESINIRWTPVEKLKKMLEEDESKFFPMHINALKKYISLKYIAE